MKIDLCKLFGVEEREIFSLTLSKSLKEKYGPWDFIIENNELRQYVYDPVKGGYVDFSIPCPNFAYDIIPCDIKLNELAVYDFKVERLLTIKERELLYTIICHLEREQIDFITKDMNTNSLIIHFKNNSTTEYDLSTLPGYFENLSFIDIYTLQDLGL